MRVVRELSAAGVPVGAMLAPVIPGLTDHEIERLLEAAAAAGAKHAGFLMLRLPFEVAGMFEAWLREHYPQRADRVLNLIREMRGGRLERSPLRSPHAGPGRLCRSCWDARFQVACRRLGLNEAARAELDTTQFLRNPGEPSQGDLFA